MSTVVIVSLSALLGDDPKRLWMPRECSLLFNHRFVDLCRIFTQANRRELPLVVGPGSSQLGEKMLSNPGANSLRQEFPDDRVRNGVFAVTKFNELDIAPILAPFTSNFAGIILERARNTTPEKVPWVTDTSTAFNRDDYKATLHSVIKSTEAKNVLLVVNTFTNPDWPRRQLKTLSESLAGIGCGIIPLRPYGMFSRLRQAIFEGYEAWPAEHKLITTPQL